MRFVKIALLYTLIAGAAALFSSCALYLDYSWLHGSWMDTDSADENTGVYVFADDGTYSLYFDIWETVLKRQGTWSITGDRFTLDYQGTSKTYNLKRGNANDFELIGADETLHFYLKEVYHEISAEPIYVNDPFAQSKTLVSGQEVLYSFEAVNGATYTVTWDDSVDGSGGYSGDVSVSAYNKDKSQKYFTNIDDGYSTAQTFAAAASETVYLEVVDNGTGGDFGISVSAPVADISTPITVGEVLSDVSIGLGELHYYSFSVTSVVSYRVTWDDFYDGSGGMTADVVVAADGAANYFSYVDSGFTTPQQFSGAADETVYLSVEGWEAGTYSIEVAEELPITVDGAATSSTATAGNVFYASFAATAGTSYIVMLDDASDTNTLQPGDVTITAANLDYTNEYFTNIDDGWVTPPGLTAAVNEPLYIKATGLSDGAVSIYVAQAPGVTVNGAAVTPAMIAGDRLFYSFPTTSATDYTVTLNDLSDGDGLGTYTGDAVISCRNADGSNSYFSLAGDAYGVNAQTFTASADEVVYLDVLCAVDGSVELTVTSP